MIVTTSTALLCAMVSCFVDYKGAKVTCITDAYLYIKQTAKMT